MLEENQTINTMIQEKTKNKDIKSKKKTLRNSIYITIILSIICSFIIFLFFSVLQIKSVSMEPTLYRKDIIVTVKTSNLKQNDIVAFRCNKKILVKRIIACEGDWIDIDEEGNVYVNGEQLNESYISNKSKGECNIKLPYQIPKNQVFVLGDNRSSSIDSRNLSIGSILENQIIGKMIYCFRLDKNKVF